MIGFIGLSHLGIVYSLASAAKGFETLGFDPNPSLCDKLNLGQFPVAEPGLEDLFHSHRQRIRFSSQPADLSRCDVVFFSLDVPTDPSNRSNLEPLRKLIDQVSAHIAPEATVVILCQVPPGFTRSLGAELSRKSVPWSAHLYYQVETLIFGNAVERALKPERYIVGCAESNSFRRKSSPSPLPSPPGEGETSGGLEVREFKGQNPPLQNSLPETYAGWLKAFECPILTMRYESAELTKTAINLFLVSSVTTTNTLAELCEQIGADWAEIVPALRLDKRIGAHAYLSPGLGLSGGNLERDLVTVQNAASEHGTEAAIIDAWQLNSRSRRDWVLRKLHELVLTVQPDARLAIWGLAYKPNTHSTKNSPSLSLIEALAPFEKCAYDPQARLEPGVFPRLELATSALDACRGAAALVVMTPWAEFSQIDLAKIKGTMAGKVIIDPFGALNREACVVNGFAYHRLGVGAGKS